MNHEDPSCPCNECALSRMVARLTAKLTAAEARWEEESGNYISQRDRAEKAEAELAEKMLAATTEWRRVIVDRDLALAQLGEARELMGDFREGISADGYVAWSREELMAWYKAMGDILPRTPANEPKEKI